jgi:hypothetical protein
MNRDAAVVLLDRYDITDEHITACWLLPLDQRAFDAIWGA